MEDIFGAAKMSIYLVCLKIPDIFWGNGSCWALAYV